MINLPQEVFLETGAFFFGGGRTRVRTLLGSCVAITLWHPRRLIGGMCHYLLPKAEPAPAAESAEGLYADRAIQMFVREIEKHSTRACEYQVKIFGGGTMLRRPASSESRLTCLDIPAQNVSAARDLLGARGFNISKQDTGGSDSRQVILELWNGAVWLRRGQTTANG